MRYERTGNYHLAVDWSIKTTVWMPRSGKRPREGEGKKDLTHRSAFAKMSGIWQFLNLIHRSAR